jgi:ribosomal protein L19
MAAVVVSGRTARTVRLAGHFARVRLGQRLAVTATRRADGTYDARRVRALGRTTRARFAAVVVKQDRTRRRMILSAGKSVFAVRHRAGGRTMASTSAGGLAPGDRVVVSVRLSAGGSTSTGVQETGRSRLVELEGIFLARRGDGFDVAVVERGAVHVEVPEGAVLPDFEPGDQVSMLVLIGKDGSFTFIRGKDESDKRPGKPHKEGIEAQGVLAEKAPYSIAVRTEGDRRVECAVPAGMDLSLFRVGERVKIYCVSRENRDVLVKIHSNYGWVKADGSGELSVYGALSKGAGTVSVRREDGMTVSCSVPGGIDLSPFRAGERVKLRCRLGEGGFVFASIQSESASLGEDGVLQLYASGLLQERTGVPITVRRPDGTMFSCNAPVDFDLSYFAVGESISLTCRVDGGTNTLLKARSERYEVGADGSVSVYMYGTLDTKTETSVSVRGSDNHVVMCTVPAGTDLGAFGVGVSVKMHCQKLGGELRLEYLKSEAAVIEIGH